MELRGSLTVPKRVPYMSENAAEILYGTTAEWNAKTDLISKRNTIYVYTDHVKNEEDQDVPGIKIGDGKAYVVDLPFIAASFAQAAQTAAVAQTAISGGDGSGGVGGVPVTQEEKDNWDNKLSGDIDPDDPENFVFSIG